MKSAVSAQFRTALYKHLCIYIYSFSFVIMKQTLFSFGFLIAEL